MKRVDRNATVRSGGTCAPRAAARRVGLMVSLLVALGAHAAAAQVDYVMGAVSGPAAAEPGASVTVSATVSLTGASSSSTPGSPLCPAGSLLDPRSGKCEAPSVPPCPSGYGYDAAGGTCVIAATLTPAASCPSGYDFDAASSTCLGGAGSACPVGASWGAYEQACVSGAPLPGFNWDGEGGQYMGPWSCPAAYALDRQRGSCSGPRVTASCPDGTTLDAVTVRCAAAAPSPCAAGQVYDPLTTKCDFAPVASAAAPACPPGYVLEVDTNRCAGLADSACPKGSAYGRYERGCVSGVALPGFSWDDEVGAYIGPWSCPIDFKLAVATGSCSGAACVAGAAFDASSGRCQGGAPVSAPPVEFYVGADAGLVTRVATVCSAPAAPASGSAVTVSCQGTLPGAVGAGAYYLGAAVDPGGAFAETDETNNVSPGVPFLVGPDLVVNALAAPAAAASGTSITVTDTVVNRGSAASAFTVGYYLSRAPAGDTAGVPLGTRNAGGLAGGTAASATTTLQIPAGLSGTWYLTALADPGNALAEAVETNNASAAVAIELVYDTTPPRITFTGATDGEVTNALPLDVCYAATDKDLVSDEGTLDGIPFRGCATVIDPGAHVVAVSASDFIGNVTTAQVAFTIDVARPSLSIDGVAEGWLGNAPSLTPTFVATDEHLASVVATLDGVAFTSGTPVSEERDHLLVVVATDLAGNVTSAQRAFGLDRSAPSISFPGIVEGAVFAGAVTPAVAIADLHPGTSAVTLDSAAWAPGTAVDAEGDHALWATATDAAGNTTTAHVTFVIDRTAPVVTLVAPAQGLTTALSSIEVVATVTEDHGQPQVTIGSAPVTRGADGRYAKAVALTEGPNTLTVTAHDGVGNVSSKSVVVRRDTALPELHVLSPAEGANLTSRTVTVSGTATDGSALKVKVAGSEVPVDAANAFTSILTLGAGPQAIEVVAIDAAGNTATVVRNVTIAVEPPAVSITEPQAGFVATKAPIRVRGTATTESAGGLTLTVNGGPVAVSGGTFSTTVGAAVGPVTVTVVATDAEGRSTTRTVTGTLGTDTRPSTPPPAGTLALSLDSPAEGSIVGKAGVVVSGRVEGGTPPVAVTVAGQSTLATAGYFDVALALVEGEHTLVVKAEDAAGHAVFAERTVSVDHTPPYLSITRPSSTSAQVTESPYLIEGTVGDVHLASVTVGGQPAAVLAGAFSRSVPLQVGANAVEVIAKDAAGNTTTRTVNLSIAALPPAVQILAPADGAEASGAVVHVRARVEATSEVQTVTIGAGAAAREGTDWGADVALALGENVVTVIATDASGLSGSATVRVKYKDVTQEPLAVTGADPAPGASAVESNSLISVSFNKPVRRESLDGHFTVAVDGVPLAGGYYLAPGEQTASFVAKSPLPEGKRVDVRVDGVAAQAGPGMGSAFAARFAVRGPRLELVGHVLDAQLQPLDGVQVTVEGTGTSTRTGAEGSWHLLGLKPGAAVLRFEGGALGDGAVMPAIRRRVFVSGTESTTDPNLVMVPVDRSAVSRVDARADMHLGFAGVHGPLAIDAPASGLYFENGKTAGLMNATRIPPYALPVPIENGRALLAGVWQLSPIGTRFTAPVELTFPNLTGLPAGRYATVYGYDPARHMLQRVAIARVATDGQTIKTIAPATVAALDFFGYGPATDEQQAWIEKNLGTGSPGDSGTSAPSGTTGMNDGPPEVDPVADLPLIARLAMLPLGASVAHAQFFPMLGGFGPLPEPKVGMAFITGKIRSPQEMQFDVKSYTALVTGMEVPFPYLHPVKFRAQPAADGSRMPITLKLRAQRGATAVSAPAGETWTSTGELAEVSGTVALEPGTTLITAEAQQYRDGRTLQLEAKVVELDPEVDPSTGKRTRKARVSVRELEETAESMASSGISFFRNWPVEVTSDSQVRGVSGVNGGFSIPVFSWGADQGALVCTEVQTGLRWIVQVDASAPEQSKLVQWAVTDGFPVCQTVQSVAPGTSSPVSLLVDMRLLMGGLTFHNRDESRVPLACGSDRTTWDPNRSELTRISTDDLKETEVFFFKEDDLSTPIANYAMAVPPDASACTADSLAYAEYKKLRYGPSERWTKRDIQECDRLKRDGSTSTDFYKLTCEGKDRVLRVRLSKGDRIVVFAVNHATGYAGATLVVVPPITTGQGLDASGKCPADEAAGGPVTFPDFGQEMKVSRCARQDLTITGNIRMYPPEVDVRVSRRARSGGAVKNGEDHLVRHGSSATVRDDFVSVATHWRVRLPPEDLDGDGTPNMIDKCPKVPGPPATNGCPDPNNPGWTPPPRIVPPPVAPVLGSWDTPPGTPGSAWPYQYSGAKPGPGVDPFDADGDGIPDVLYDRDGDGVPDVADRCPLLRGENGADCPSGADSDQDGTPDAQEARPECIHQAGPPETQGCPDPARPDWRPTPNTGAADSDGDGIPDAQDLCPFYPGPAVTSGPGLNGCPSLVSRFDTDGDGTSDADDECIWQPGPPESAGCPDPAHTDWTAPPPPPAIAGGPGKMLETYCSELTSPSPEQVRMCTRFEARLMDVPAGVPPLAGQLVRVTGTAVETPAVAVFPVRPGKATGNVQVALRLMNAAGAATDPGGAGTVVTTNLAKANYYVHVVGNLTLFNDRNGDKRIDPATEIATAPPAFNEPKEPPAGWKPGMPERAIALKNVYKSLEPDGTVLARFDRDREHEFRVLDLSLTGVNARQADGTWRDVTKASGTTTAHSAQDGDLAYQFLMHLVAPDDPGRAGTLPGSYRVRIGTDDYGLDCGVKLSGQDLVATCDGAWLYDVLSARDVVYLSLSMAGNGENMLYKYNLQGLSPRRDLVTAGHQATLTKSEQPDGASGAAALRPISEPALANVFFGPSQFKHGRVRICADGCSSGDGVVRELDLTWQSSGAYAVAEVSGKGAIEQVPRAGIGAAALFRVPLRPQDVWMPGFTDPGRAAPPALLVEWVDLDDPAQTPHTVNLGKGAGVYQGTNARAPGQSGVGGVNVADGHLSFRHEDFSLPEFAGAVKFARTYNNQDNEVGTLGIGWRHSYEAYVVEESLGRYTMVLEGQSYDFPGCAIVDPQTRSADACQTDNAHGGLLTVKERSEGAAGAQRHVPDVVFTATNGRRYRFDRYSQKALQSVDETVTARLVQEQAEYQHRTNDSTAIKTPVRWKKIRDAGRRRWVLTAIDDGHGRLDEAGATRPGKGWTIVEYFADSDMIRRVYRKGGKLGLYFSYDAVDATLPSRYQAAAVAENLGLLKMVEARFQGAAGDGAFRNADANGDPKEPNDFIVRLRLSRSADGRGNLARVERIASEDKVTVDQAWAYGYVDDLQALAGVGKKLSGQDLWDATNELERAELEIGGVVQSRTRWRRALTWAGAYPHLKRFEIVDRVTLPGSSTVSAEAAPVDAELEIAWTGETRREVKRTDGVVVKLDLTQNYGSVSGESIGQSTVSTEWFNERSEPGSEAGKVQPSARQVPGGRKLAFDSDARLRPTTLRLAAVGMDTLPAAFKDSSKPLRSFLDRDDRFGVPALTERETGSGTARFETPVDPGTGDPTSVTVTDPEKGEIAKWSQVRYDAEGVLEFEVDGAGRETKHEDPSGQNAWGLRLRETTWLRGAAAGARDTVVVTREHDWLGRVNREADDAGHVQEWTFDANGRLRRRFVKGTPDQEWRYEYLQTGDRELTVRETLAGTSHERTRVYRDGLLVKEQWSCDGGPAVRTSAYVGGRLAFSKDERGVTRDYEYDPEHGWLMRVLASGRGAEKVPELKYERDAEGKVTSETDQNGLTVVTGHDVLGRPARWSYGDGDVETVKRDANGAVTERTHGSYVWTSKVDALGRVRSTENSDGKQVQTTTDYDKVGRKVASHDAVLGVAETWEYQDVLGRQTRYTRTVQPYTETYEETRTYTDSDTAHTVEILEKVGEEIVKRRTLTLDAMGRTLHTLEYVPRGTASVEAHRYFTYDPYGNVLFERAPIGDGPTTSDANASTATTGVVARTFDAAGRLLTVKDAGGTTTTYGLDPDGQVRTQQGPHRDERWTFEYDAFGQLKTKTLAGPADPAAAGWNGAVWGYTYAAADGGATVRETDPRGFTTERWYNARHRLSREVRSGPTGKRETTTTYDGPWASAQTTRETGADGKAPAVRTLSRPRYDHRGRVLEETETFSGPESGAAYSYTTTLAWAGRVADPVRQTWSGESRTGRREVDGLENEIAQTWGAYTDARTYDAAGRLRSEVPSGKPETRRTYAEGLLTAVTVDGKNAGTEVTSYAYYASGQLQTELRPDGRERRLSWNGRGLLEQEEYGSGASFDRKQYGYDESGKPQWTRHGTGSDVAEWKYTHGPRGELVSVTQPGALGTFRYGYDEAAELASISPPAGPGSAAQTFEYDFLGRQTLRTRGGAAWTTSWSSGTATVTEPPDATYGQRVTYRALDGRGRVALERYSGVGVGDLTQVETTYDALDQPLMVSETRRSGTATVTYGYQDDRKLLTRVARTEPSRSEVVSYGRTASGQVESVTSPAGRIDYGYDAFGRLGELRSAGRTTTVTWEPGGERLRDVSDTATLQECRRYDGRGRVRLVANVAANEECESSLTPLARYEYGYDERGNRTSELYTSRTVSVPESTEYGYDRADRLTGVLNADGTAKLYQLGGDGSRTAEREVSSYAGPLTPDGFDAAGGAVLTYGYDGRGGLRAITDASGSAVVTYTVDVAGRVHAEVRGADRKEFTWDVAGRLSEANVTTGAGSSTTTLTYRYDHAGRRIEKQGPAGTARYVWGAGELVEEQLPGGRQLVYERAGELVTGVGGYGAGGASTGTERLMHEGLGSVVGRVRGDGTVATYRYDGWGGFRGSARPSGVEATLAYAGQHWDEDLGLSYAQQRWYSPGTGRFLSEDPVGWNAERLSQPTRGHAFGYAAGNPLLYTDPEGLDVGQPESTTRRAQEDMSYEAARNEWSKEEGNWVTGCLAAEADNWRHIDSAAFNARSKSPGWLAGYMKCQGRPVADAWHDSDIGKTTREFWTATPGRSGTMGCFIGGVNAITPVGGGDVNDLPASMQQSAGMCQFAVGGATLGVMLIEQGPGALQKLKDASKVLKGEPALVAVTADGRTVAVAGEEVSAGERMPTRFEASARAPQAAQRAKPPNLPGWRDVEIDMEEVVTGHTVQGGRAIQSGKKDIFPQWMNEEQIQRAIRNAYRYGKKVKSQGPRVQVRGPFLDGIIEMWVNVEEKVIETAYPKL